jgi:hypothetical protein
MPGSKTFTVHKLDHIGREVWRYPARLLERGLHHVRLEALFNRDDMDLGFTVFRRGDRFVESFYDNRWYNVFAVYDRDNGVLKGWYCNVCRPAQIDTSSVHCEDLALDVWVAPTGDLTLLDEDEFEKLPLTATEQSRARASVSELERLARRRLLPR